MIVLKLSAEESLTRKVAGRQPQRLRELLQRKYPFPSAYSRLKSVQNALCHQTTSNFQNTQTPQNILPFPKSLSLFSWLGHTSSDQLHSSFLPPAAHTLSSPSSSSLYAPGLLSLISSPSAPLTSSCASPSCAPQQLPVPLHFRCFTGPRIQNGSQQVHKSSSTLLCSSSTPSAPPHTHANTFPNPHSLYFRPVPKEALLICSHPPRHPRFCQPTSSFPIFIDISVSTGAAEMHFKFRKEPLNY